MRAIEPLWQKTLRLVYVSDSDREDLETLHANGERVSVCVRSRHNDLGIRRLAIRVAALLPADVRFVHNGGPRWVAPDGPHLVEDHAGRNCQGVLTTGS